MKPSIKNTIMSALVLMCLFNSTTSFAQYTDLKRLGTSQAICKKPGVQSAAELQTFFANNAALINSILEDANWQGDSQQLFEMIANGDFTEKQYYPGTTFEWMGMREKGKPTAQPLRRWAGKTAFDGYEVNISNACINHQLVIPKICCNLALAATTTITEEPNLNISTDDSSLEVCTDPDAKVSLTEPDGVSSDLALNENGCWNGSDLKSGGYNVVADGECGQAQQFINVGAVAQDANKKNKPFVLIPFIAAFAGTETLMRYEPAWDMDMRDSSGLVGARAGLKLPLRKSLFLVPSLGFMHRNGVNDENDYPDNTASLDLGIEKFITNKLFIGAGIGAWNVDESDFREGSLFINAGGSITQSTEWFVEARGIDSDNQDGRDGFSDNRTFNAGIRVLFNN